jgi:magnesium transporter
MTPTRSDRKVRFGAVALLGPEIEEMVRVAPGELAEATEDVHPADLAEIVEDLDHEDRVTLITALPANRAGELIEYLDRSLLADVVGALDPERAALVLRAMPPDERADTLGALEREQSEAILARLPRDDRDETRRLLAYPRHSAGGLMTPNFVALSADQTAGEALERVRREAPDVETIYALYVVDGGGRLTGLLSLRDLLISGAEESIREIMRTEFVSARVHADQEEVANLISKYDLLALPVLDAEQRLLGIVTVDDVVDVLVEESTEDVQKMGAVAPLEGGYFQSSFWRVARSRAGWLAILFFGEMFTTHALHYYEATLESAIALVFYLPLILSSGGNSGSQSASLITRGLALGDVTGKHALAVAGREAMTGLLMGAFVGGVGVLRALWGGQGLGIGLAVGATLISVVTVGALVGGMLPLLLKRLGLDPAVVSSPFVASLVDVLGIVLYFSIAKAILGM